MTPQVLLQICEKTLRQLMAGEVDPSHAQAVAALADVLITHRNLKPSASFDAAGIVSAASARRG